MLISILMGLSAFSQEIILNEETNGSIVTTCSATLYDSGGLGGNYSYNENYAITFCSGSDLPMVVNVISLYTESSFDYLRLYDGENTLSENLIAFIAGNSFSPQIDYSATSGCVTISWHSDGSINRAGFELNIRCATPYQEYSVSIIPDAQYDSTQNAYLCCSSTTFSAQIDFPHNNENYEQTIENTTFSWHVLGNNRMQVFERRGLNELSEELDQGVYSVSLVTTDVNHYQVVAEEVLVYISGAPTFVGTTVPSEMLLGTEVSLNGVVNPPDEWHQTAQQVIEEQICIYDQHSICFLYSEFAPDQTIQSADDIESIGLQMEHSYIGDLDIILQCPNGQSMTLFQQTCGAAFFGEAVDYDTQGVNSSCDGSEWVGVGYDYYWTAENNNGLMSRNCPGYSVPLPSGNYQPVDSFSNLIGCPLNGEWCIKIHDHLAVDDGTVFRTELHFADNLYPVDSNLISFQYTYGNDMWWEGEALQYEGLGANNIAIPTTHGHVEYTFSATDNFGCTYDTTLIVNVREFPCQDYSVAIITDAQYSESDSVYFGCSGSTFSAQIDFPHNNENYEQTIENITFSWRVLGNNILQDFEDLGLAELPYSFETGIYFISLTTTDSNGCQIALEDIPIYISAPPTFLGTTATSEITLGTEVLLNGVINPPSECSLEMLEMVNNESFCSQDIVNAEQSVCFNFTEFAPDQTIQSASDIESICMDMEHSYIGDLDIWIVCPSGNRMELFNGYASRNCSWEFLGEPVDEGDDACVPGVPYHYCWNHDAAQTIEAASYNPPLYTYTNNVGYTYTGHPYIPAGEYLPIGDWTSLVGCPLNGEWCIKIWDNLNLDDGTIFRIELHLASNLLYPVEDNLFSFQNTYGNEMWWEGEALQYEGMGANNIAIPTTLGQFEYTFSATDNFGCTYDTTLYVNVLPATGIDEVSGDDILVFPNPVSDILAITASEVISEIEIVNDKGQIVRRMDVNGNTAACNVSELASGVYVVRIYNRSQSRPLSVVEGSVVWQRKFVKE